MEEKVVLDSQLNVSDSSLKVSLLGTELAYRAASRIFTRYRTAIMSHQQGTGDRI